MGAIIVDVKQQPNPRGRLYFVDWLRVMLTINVVVMHSMLTYTSDGERDMKKLDGKTVEPQPEVALRCCAGCCGRRYLVVPQTRPVKAYVHMSATAS